MAEKFPDQAKIVIIGGGVVGCSTAYHLTHNGCADVVLIERNKLTSGSTWHAAGAIAQYRPNNNLMNLAAYAVRMIPELENETGQATGWRQTGGMRISTRKERRAEYERTITAARSFGLEMGLIGPKGAKEKFPLMHTDDLDCSIWIPSDGLVSPSDMTMALAKGARMKGAKILEDTAVTDFVVTDGRLEAVVTDQGTIKCEGAAICAGVWSRKIGRLAGVDIPIWPSHHCYMITEKIEGITPDLPVMRDPELYHYIREEVGGLMVGQYEPDPVPYPDAAVPDDFVFHLMPENLDHFMPHMMPLVHRFPVLEAAGVKTWINGLESFTEDQNPVLGETEIDGLFTACGFNAYGITVGPGFGMALGEWMMNGEPPFDLWGTDIRRFAKFHGSDAQVRARATEGQGHHYTVHWPYEEHQAGRPLRRSAVYDRLAAAGACFGAKAGWERPNWFAPRGVEPRDEYSFGRQNWFPHVAAEHRTCREAAALFDQSYFSKFMLLGRDAEASLQRLCAGNLAKPPGRVTYTQMLNAEGGIESDLTIARLAEDAYYIVTGTAFATHDSRHIRRHLPAGAAAHLVDVTSAFGTLSVMGPNACDILGEVTEGEFGPEAFPFGAVREIFIAGAPVRAIRLSFVGELGWELHIPTEYMLTVYDALLEAGAPHGMGHAGYRAIDSLRLEKGYRVWAADIGPDYSPLEAGLSFAVSFKKDADFIGRAALEAQAKAPLTRRLVSFAIDDPDAIVMGRETIYRDGENVGWITSGGHGHTVDREIGLGYVRHADGVSDDFLTAAAYEIEIATRRFPATLHTEALYDPENTRIRP